MNLKMYPFQHSKMLANWGGSNTASIAFPPDTFLPDPTSISTERKKHCTNNAPASNSTAVFLLTNKQAHFDSSAVLGTVYPLSKVLFTFPSWYLFSVGFESKQTLLMKGTTKLSIPMPRNTTLTNRRRKSWALTTLGFNHQQLFFQWCIASAHFLLLWTTNLKDWRSD